MNSLQRIFFALSLAITPAIAASPAWSVETLAQASTEAPSEIPSEIPDAEPSASDLEAPAVDPGTTETEIPADPGAAELGEPSTDPTAPSVTEPTLQEPGIQTVEDIPSEQLERIQTLIELTDADSIGIEIAQSMMAQFRTAFPDVPNEWAGISDKFQQTDLSQLIAPIYARNYTDAEIDALIAFYQTPEGESIVAKTPAIAQESLAVGQEWGLAIAQELLQELEAEGFSLEQPPTAAPTAEPSTTPSEPVEEPAIAPTEEEADSPTE